jgi:deazaflavin-dependent oxidoreductase (nitroreductase family)
MHFPRFMRRVNRVFTNPVLKTIAWIVPPMAVIGHVGRKSGRPYRSPVVAFRNAHGFVIPMTYGSDVDWARNLVAAGGGEVQQMGRRFHVRNPRIVDGKKAQPELPLLARPLVAANLPGFVLVDLG